METSRLEAHRMEMSTLEQRANVLRMRVYHELCVGSSPCAVMCSQEVSPDEEKKLLPNLTRLAADFVVLGLATHRKL